MGHPMFMPAIQNTVRKSIISCVGDVTARTGKSDGPVSDAMNPRPRDLTDRAYMSTVSDEDLLNVIKGGGPAVGKSPAMMAFKEALSDDDIGDLIAFIRTLCCR